MSNEEYSFGTDPEVAGSDDRVTFGGDGGWSLANSTNVAVEDGSAVPETAPDSGISRWNFEDSDTASTAFDGWGDNDGSITGASYTPVDDEYALAFGGTDHVTVPDDASLRVGDFSVSVRVNSQMTSSYYEAFLIGESSESYYSWSLRMNDAVTPQFAVSYDGHNWVGATGSVELSTGTWIHLVGVYDSSTTELHLYRDGDPVDSTTLPGGRNAADEGIVMGHYPYEDTYYEGTMDDARVYDRSLSANEVQNLYETGSISG